AEPGGAGAAPRGEEEAAQQQGEAQGGTSVEGGGQQGEATGQPGGEVGEWHGRLLDTRRGCLPSSCSRGRRLATARSGSCLRPRPGHCYNNDTVRFNKRKSRKVQGRGNRASTRPGCACRIQV